MKPVLLVLVSLIASAAMADVKVKQINAASKTLTLEATAAESFSPGSPLLLNVEGGRQCPIIVNHSHGALIVADSSACNSDDLKKGQLAEPELMPTKLSEPSRAQPAATASDLTDIHRVRVSAYFYLNTGDDIRFSSATLNSGGSSASATFDFKTQSAAGLGIEAWQSSMNSWGWSGGLSIDSNRNIRSESVSTNSGSATGSLSGDSLQLTILYGNAIYRWEHWYLPFGLNFSIPRYKSSNTESVSVKGGLGLQVGVGYHFTDAFSLEFESRATTIRATADLGSGTSIDYGTGVMPSAQLSAKWDFY